MMVNDPLDFWGQVFLSDIEGVVINEDDFIDLTGLVLCLEFIPEEKIFLRNAAVSEVCDYLELAEELITIAVNHWNVEDAFLTRVVVAEGEGADD